MTSYYDHVLGLIPVAFAAVAAALTFLGYSTTIAIPVAGGVAVLLVAHALFVNGPVDDVVDTVRPAAVDEAPANEVPVTAAD